MRVSKEQEHFLVLPNGLACGEVTASSLVRDCPHTHTKHVPLVSCEMSPDNSVSLC